MTNRSGTPSSSSTRSTSSWASRSWITSVRSSRLARSMCRAERLAPGRPGPPRRCGSSRARSPPPRAPGRSDAASASISSSASSSSPAAASRGASLGCSATPATIASCSAAASTAQRAPGRSQPICTIRVTPTAAAARAPRAVASQAPSGPSAMSRWQWLSTTGCGSGSGAGGRCGRVRRLVTAARRPAHGVGSRGLCTASYTSRLGSAGAPGHVEDRLLAGARRPPPPPRPARPATPGRWVRRPASASPSTTIVTSPRTPSAAQAASSASPPRRTSSWVLVSSRHTAAAPVGAERLGHRRQRGLGAVRGLEEHHRALLVAQRGQPPGALARLARQEALEAEPVDRQPGDRQRGEHRGRARAPR